MLNDEKELKVDYYRQLLKRSQTFLTELDDKSGLNETSRSTFSSRSNSNSNSNLFRSKSSLNIRHSSSSTLTSSKSSSTIDEQLIETRQRCHQRLLTCSRRKLRLLSLQEQNEKRHLGFKRFIDNLDDKRSSNIRRYQIELRDYLLNRLETDRLKEEMIFIKEKIDHLKEEKKNYLSIIDLVQKSIPLFPLGTLQGGTEGIRSLILRYQTLVETKEYFQQRDFSKEKQDKRRELQLLILSHHTNIAKLNTRLSQLHQYLNDLQKTESIKEEEMFYQMDFDRIHNTTLSQLLSSINYLYDRYRLPFQLKQSKSNLNPRDKLKIIQDFILYRSDLIQRTKPNLPD